MVKIPRRQTLLKVYRNILRKVASLSVVSMLLANTYLPYFALVPQIAHADAPPELNVSYDKNTNDLEIKINTSSKINYLVSYSHEKNGDVVLEGLQGNGDDSSGVYSKKFYLGTCSANDCVRHNIKRAVVQAYIKDLGWAREQRFVFELNLDLSLVGKTAIDVKDDMLELSTENENWLKDINTVVPSLTPTATQGPTATPIVSEIATPTPSVVVETPTVTPVIVETATPTTVPTGTVASLNEEVSVELVESVEPEPSLIDTIVSALLPFLGTDKPDYAPTEKAVITGSSFLPNTEYSITTFSADEPPVSHTDKVMTTATGTFTYEYQLDGTYRPNYAVEVRDDSGIVVATTTFTDTPPAADSCGNNILESGEECDGSDLGVLSNVDFVCKNNCTLDLVTPKVTICHASSSQSNPYISQEPNKSSDVNGHDNHTGGVWYTGIPDSSWGDIIPPFAYIGGTYPGKNWTTEGQAIWNNGCNIPEASPTPSSTPTLTPTSTTTPTPNIPSGRCGDGTLNQQSELCDDGNQNDDDYCNNNCQPNPNVCLADVNMLSNGDFEAPVVTNGAKWDIFNIFSPFIGWIPNWLSGVTSYGDDARPDFANIELHNNVNGWASASGSQHTELDSDWMGPSDNTTGEPSSVSLSQNLMTIPGYKYEVKFSYSPRPGAAAGDNVMKFDFGSNSETYGPVASGINWTSVTKEYVADSTPTTISFSDIGTANSEGMFLDNVSVICLGPDATPTPTSTNTPTPTTTPTATPTPVACVPGAAWAGKYVSHTQGLRKNGTPITDPTRMDPWKAVGAADGNFFSLGYGGTIVLEMPGYVVDKPNSNDLSFHEVTNGRSSYGIETAKVEVSQDGATWTNLGNVTNKDGGNGISYKDLNGSGLSWIKFVKVTDVTNDSSLEATADGYDLDAVDIVEQVCEEPKPPVKIVAHKIVCESEQYLPNWHNGANIGASTAQNFVNSSNGKCKFVSDWEFQWGFADKTGTQGVDKLNGEIVGLAAGQSSAGQCSAPYCGPNTQTGSAYNQWKTFGPTNNSGMTEVEITNLESAPGIWVRESLKQDYVPFSYPPQSSPGSNVSAEMYCHTDVANYDNFDQIASPQNGQTYYCVALNALNMGTVILEKQTVPDGNSTEFEFTGDLIGTLSDGEQLVAKLTVGSHSVTELVPTNWELTSIICDDSKSNNPSTWNEETRTAVFKVDPGETVKCVFTNTRQNAPLHVNKFEDINGDGDMDGDEGVLSGWTMEAYDNSTCTGSPIASATTEADGVAHILGLFVGNTYWVKEVMQSGWVNTTGNCKSVNILNTDTNNRIGFGNFEKGDMDVWKYEDIDDVLGKSSEEKYIGNPTFTFRVYKNVDSIWTKVGEADTDIDGKATFTNVFDTVGNYFVCEVKKDGWEDMRSRNNPANNLSGASDEYPVCDGITVSTSGYLRFAEFGNINKGKIKVYKFHDLDGDGKRDDGEPLLSGWNIFMDKEGADGVTEQVTDTNGGTEFTLTPGSYVLGETMQDDWYQSNIYCENDGTGVKITKEGEAYGHHGACSGWNGCRDAATCALWACEVNGYSNLVSYGAQKTCPEFADCNLFNSRGSVDMTWYNRPGCPVMGVTDIVCNNDASVSPSPSPSPEREASIFDKILGVSDVLAQPAPDGDTKNITVTPGQRTSCYIGNYQKATVTVNKNVINHKGNDIADGKQFEVTGGQALGTKNFSEVSPAVFTINPGTYNFEEINISKQYTLKEILGDENTDMENAQVTVASGGSASITFVNQKVKPKLTIRKFNDKWPNVQNTGSNILYSIVVKILDNDMQDVSMIDLPPEGFRYQSGSWKAYKNGLPYGVSEPVYSSPGTWYLGDLLENDEVLLTYTAKIDNGTGPGLYKDMAWAYGCSDTENCEVTSEDMLLASSVDSTKTDPGIITDTVVGTKIEIPRTGTQSKAINIVEKREGQVLGASDVRLPATGANDWVLVTGLGSIFTGLLFGLIYFARKRMKKISARFVTGVLAFLLFAFLTSGVEAANLTVRINEPKSPTYDSFDLGFVALDIMNRPVTARCYIKNTNNGGSYTQFDGDKLLKAGGDSEICKVTTGLLTSGSNKFKVEVAADGDTAVSQEVNVDFTPSSSGPWKPKSYGRNDVSDCSTEISFATADDNGRTVRVEIYRSTETEFTLNDGTKVTSIDVGSGQSKVYTDNVPDCAKTYYYALRAFDAANNASEHIGDSVVTVVNTTTTTSSTSSSSTGGSGAIEVIGGSNLPGGTSGTGQILGEETGLTGDISGTPGVSPTGEVLGENESTPTGSLTDTVKEISNTRGLWFIIGFLLVAAGAGVFAYYRWIGGGTKSK